MAIRATKDLAVFDGGGGNGTPKKPKKDQLPKSQGQPIVQPIAQPTEKTVKKTPTPTSEPATPVVQPTAPKTTTQRKPSEQELAAQGHHEEVLKALQGAQGKLDAAAQPREQTAEELAAQGRYDEALKKLQGAQGKLDAAAQPREQTAEEQAAQGRYDEALKKMQGAQGKLDAAAQPRAETGQEQAARAEYERAMAALRGMEGDAPVYSGGLDKEIGDLYAKITGRGDFQYDLNEDAMWQQLKDDYTRLGKQSMQDAMGQAAALTGGYGSSYGQMAGQAAYDRYLTQLSERAPELYDRAYQRYRDEGDEMRKNLSFLVDRDATAYGRFQDEYNRYLADRSYNADRADSAYARMSQERSYADERYDTAYQRALQELGLAQERESEAYSRAQRERTYGDERYDAAYERALQELGLAQEREGEAYTRAQRERAYGDERYDAAYDRALRELGLAQEREGEAYSRAQRERAYGDERADLDYERAQQERAYGDTQQGDRRNLLLSLMEIGYTPTAQEIAEAGLSQAQADALSKYYKSLLQPAPSGGGGSYSGGTEKKATESGKAPDAVSAIWASEEMSRYHSPLSPQPLGDWWGKMAETIADDLGKAESREEAEVIWDRIPETAWSRMSDKERTEIDRALRRVGL